MHFLMLSFVVVATFAVMAVLFVVWLIASILRGITRLLTGPGLHQKPRISPPAMPVLHSSVTNGLRPCQRNTCRAANPVGARFCRRCGHGIEAAQAVRARRVAMF